jgi:hypothetical protein
MPYLGAECAPEDSGEGLGIDGEDFRMDSSRTWPSPKVEEDELKNKDSTRSLYFLII